MYRSEGETTTTTTIPPHSACGDGVERRERERNGSPRIIARVGAAGDAARGWPMFPIPRAMQIGLDCSTHLSPTPSHACRPSVSVCVPCLAHLDAAQIAVEGCSHGSLDEIYATVRRAEESKGFKVDLLLLCGDFQVGDLGDTCFWSPF